jgi:hypothetical protein
MQLPSALLSIPGLHPPTLCYPGHLIGRSASAHLRVHHPAVSEVHALISLRGGELWLLALRHPLPLQEGPDWQVRLQVGADIALAEGVTLQVHQVWSSAEQLALVMEEGAPIVLGGESWLVAAEGQPARLLSSPHPGALARFWSTDGELWMQTAQGVAMPVEPGDRLTVGAHAVRCVIVDTPGMAWTRVQGRRPRVRARVSPRLALVEDDEGHRVELTGHAAVTLWSLACWTEAEGEQAAPWTVVANALWGGKRGPAMRDNLRNNVLYRLDQRLRAHGLRDDLVCRDEGVLWFAEGVQVERVGEQDG